jgi:hypothetical protein
MRSATRPTMRGLAHDGEGDALPRPAPSAGVPLDVIVEHMFFGVKGHVSSGCSPNLVIGEWNFSRERGFRPTSPSMATLRSGYYEKVNRTRVEPSDGWDGRIATIQCLQWQNGDPDCLHPTRRNTGVRCGLACRALTKAAGAFAPAVRRSLIWYEPVNRPN